MKNETRINDRSQKTIGILLILGFLAAAGAGLWRPTLWGPTEPRVIEISREQYADNGLIGVPTFAGMPFLEKPPLYYSHVALMFHLFGKPSVLAARLATYFWVLLWIAAVVLMTQHAAGWRAGLLAGALLMASGSFFRLARRIQIDVALAALLCLALLFFFIALTTRQKELRKWPWMACLAMVGLASLVKGIFALAVFLLPALCYAVWDRDWRVIKGLVHPLALTLLFGPLMLWCIQLYATGGLPYIFESFINNSIGRFLHFQFPLPGDLQLPYADVGGTRPWYYYPVKAPEMIGPAVIFLPFAAVAFWRGHLGSGPQIRMARMAICWAVVPLLALSFSAQKGVHHLGASFTGFIIFSALWLENLFRKDSPKPYARIGFWLTVASGIAAPIALGVSWLDGFDLMPALITAAVAVGAIGLASLMVNYRRRHFRLGTWGLSAAVMALFVIGFSQAPVAKSDSRRSISAFAQWVASETAGCPVGVYYDGDHTLGAFAFALNGAAVPLRSIADVANLLSSATASYCVIPLYQQKSITRAIEKNIELNVFAIGGNQSKRFVVLANSRAIGLRPTFTQPPPFADD